MKTMRIATLAVSLALGTGALAKAPDITRTPFLGHFRATAKTTMAGAAVEPIGSVAKLLASVRPDPVMRQVFPAISGMQAPMDRVPDEMRVVALAANLYAVKFENGANGGDNDFHCIVGDSAQGPFLNVEVSGVPGTGNRAPFVNARQQLVQLTGLTHFGSAFAKMQPPIPVTVTGSLYFDGDHVAGAVGPTGMKPKTVWEIHPVQTIVRR